MINFIDKRISCTPLWCAAIIMMSLICCSDDTPRPPDKKPYKWEWENKDFIAVNPYYEDGFYYIFSEPWTSSSWSMTKVRETNGEIIYKVPIRDNVDVPKFDCYFRGGDRLMLVEGNFIHQINMKNGSIVTDTFDNYIWNFQWTKDQITGCGWTDNYNTFKFFEIQYIDGHYREKIIHSEYFPRINSNTNLGTPPIYKNGKWVMGYATGDLSTSLNKNYLIIKEQNSVRRQLIYENSKGYSFNSILVDDNTYYAFCVDKLFAFDRTTGLVNWETSIEANTFFTIMDNKIYILDGSDSYRMNIINKDTGQKEVLTQDPCWQGKIVGDYLIWVHGYPNFFNLKSKITSYSPNIPISPVGDGSWGVPFGVSEKSILLHDGLKFECFPF